MAGIRQEKIASMLKRELALIFQREASTLFNGRFITITVVRLTPDLGMARVYLSILATKDVKADLAMIREQTWKVRKLLAETAGKHLRKMPEISFFIDDSLDYFEEVDRLLK
ncbi:MAG: ribosome-binding factor A [Flavobacteriales bacterium]|jgi:ribosome-binding factor A